MRAAGRRARSPRRCEPGLRTRAFIFNTLLQDKATKDRLRSYPHWLASRNLANEASDESVAALIEAVAGRYELARRWYRLKARLLGLDKLAYWDRDGARRPRPTSSIPYDEAREIVLDCYSGFSPELGEAAAGFFERRLHRRRRRGPGKRGGAFCSYTVPSQHPYVMLNYTSRPCDVLTMAHELGHGVHATLARAAGDLRVHDAADGGRDRLDLRRDDRARRACSSARPTPPRGCRCWPARSTARSARCSARSR